MGAGISFFEVRHQLVEHLTEIYLALMTNDHFVARTYLHRFGDPTQKGMLNAYRKIDGEQFPCWPADVCIEWNGDLNPTWLREPALLGDHRKIFEGRWKIAVERLHSKTPSHEDRLVIAGYVANLMTCTPAWRRIGVQVNNDHTTGYLIFCKQMQEKHGGNPELPTDAIARMEAGEIGIEHDPNFVKAVYTRQLMEHAWGIYHYDWEITENNTPHPFITSDNPVAIVPSPDIRVSPIRVVALAPSLALSFRAAEMRLPPFDLALPPRGKLTWRATDAVGARSINKTIAKCAEELVLCSYRSDGLASLVANCAKFRVEAEYVELPAPEPDAIYQGTIIRVRETYQR